MIPITEAAYVKSLSSFDTEVNSASQELRIPELRSATVFELTFGGSSVLVGLTSGILIGITRARGTKNEK